MRSMTGFGAGESVNSRWHVTAELTGVNRKQLDISLALPQSLGELEPTVRQTITREVSRGRINVRIAVVNLTGQDSVLRVDRDLARQFVDSIRSLSEENDLSPAFTASDLVRCPGLFQVEDVDVQVTEIEDLVTTSLCNALERLKEMQVDEGKHLQADLEGRLRAIESEVNSIRGHSTEVVQSYRQNLKNRLAEAGLPIDPDDERVMREIALYAERCDITEELTRITSHLAQFRRYFSSDDPVGRPLDFLCQELNRELNTIGSKANHAGIAQSIVNSKTELEKIREQVQNIQ